ncbi:MAG: hypothetical protein WA941_21995 [Nitrososphaeraceae archaeon]
MINHKLFGVLLLIGAVASSVLLAAAWSQNASASAYGADLDVEEAEEVLGNATTTNKTTSANMTGAGANLTR